MQSGDHNIQEVSVLWVILKQYCLCYGVGKVHSSSQSTPGPDSLRNIIKFSYYHEISVRWFSILIYQDLVLLAALQIFAGSRCRVIKAGIPPLAVFNEPPKGDGLDVMAVW